ncbi:MAG: hypothetical protein GY756_13040 [bacterium]|nr:hypothetical protein [bacterium]
MKRISVIILIGISFILTSMSGDIRIKSKEVKKVYKEFISVSIRKGKDDVDFRVDSIKSNHYLAPFVNDNIMLITYIFNNYGVFYINYETVFTDKKINELKSDDNKLNEYFFNNLNNDKVFNKHFLQLTYNYLKKRDTIISDFKPMPEVEISLDSITSIASRFYYLLKIDNAGKIKFKICIGIHGCDKNPNIEMLPIIEGFCFQVIRFAKDDVYNDYKKAINEIKNLKIEMNNEDKEIYLRNLMYKKMQNSKNLRKEILAEYEKRKEILNFTIIK